MILAVMDDADPQRPQSSPRSVRSGKRRAPKGNPKPTRRRDGRWAVYVELPQSGGQRRRHPIYGSSPSEVRALAAKAKATLASGRPLPDRRTNLSEVLAAWLLDRDRSSLRRSTLVPYETHCRLHIAPHLGTIAIGKLTADQIEEWLAALADDGVSAAMRRKVLVTLRAALSWAVIQGYIPISPASGVRLPDRGKPKPWRPLPDADVQKIYDAVEGHRLRTLFRLALSAGPRQGELLALTRDDLNYENHTITIAATLSWVTGVRGQSARYGPKTKAAYRTIPLSDYQWNDLMDHLERMDAEAAAGGWEPAGGLVFVRSNGRPLRGDGTGGVGDQYKRCLVRAGIEPHNFHTTRHIAASAMLRYNSDNLTQVAQVLGHSTYRHTIDMYGHLVPDATREVLSRVADRYYQHDRQSNRQSDGPTSS